MYTAFAIDGEQQLNRQSANMTISRRQVIAAGGAVISTPLMSASDGGIHHAEPEKLSGKDWVSGDGLQAAIAKSMVGGAGRLDIETGFIIISESLTLPSRRWGGTFVGSGMNPGGLRFRANIDGGSHTTLVWTGEPGGQMWSGCGNLGCTWKRVAFVGRKDSRSSRAGVGLAVLQDGTKSSGSGMHLMEGLGFFDLDIGIKYADTQGDGNCADVVHTKLTFQDCDIAVQFNSSQCLDYQFTGLNTSRCRKVFDFPNGGGNLTVSNWNNSGCSSSRPGADDWIVDIKPQDNAGTFIFDGCRAESDNGANPSAQMIRARGLGGTVIVRGFEEVGVNTGLTMMRFEGVHAKIERGRFISHSSSNPTFLIGSNSEAGAYGSVVIDHVHFDTQESGADAKTFRLSDWLGFVGGFSQFLMQDCTFGNQAYPLAIPNMNNVFSAGPTYMFGSSEMNGAQMLTTTGRSLDMKGRNIVDQPYQGILLPRSVCFVEAIISGISEDGRKVGHFRRSAVLDNTSGTSFPVVPVQTLGTDFNPCGWLTPEIVSGPQGFGTIRIKVGEQMERVMWSAEINGHSMRAIW